MSGSLHGEGRRGLERSMYKTRVREGHCGVDSSISESGGEPDYRHLARLEWDGHGRKHKSGYSDPRRQEKSVGQIHLEPKRATNLSPYTRFRQDLRPDRIGKGSSKGFIERRDGEVDNLEKKLAGLIIVCNKRAKDRILLHEAFEIPSHRKKLLDKVVSGLKLFLFEVEDRKLFGIFEVTNGAPDIVRKGVHEDLYSALVQFRVLKKCLPLHELDFKDAIRENCYEADNLTVDLNPDQVLKLMQLFQLAEAPSRNSNAGRTTHLSPAISRGRHLIDLQQPCQELELFPEKYSIEGSQLLRKDLLVPVASRSTNLSSYKSHMYSDAISLSRYLQDPHKTKCRNSSGDDLAYKSSLDALPSTIEDKIRGGASVSSHTLFSSCYKPQDIFDESRIKAKSIVNCRSLSSAQSGIDLKADVDCWDSTYMTKLDAHANLPSNSESTDAVAYLQNVYPGHIVNVNDHLDERKFDETYTSELSRLYGYEGRELSRLYGYEGQESCTFGDKSFPTSTGCRSSNSNLVAMIDAQVAKDAPRLKSNASTSLYSSHVHNGHASSQILGTGQNVSVLRTVQDISPADLSLLTTDYRNYFVETDETLTPLPLEHAYTSNSKKLKTDTAKQNVALLSNASYSAGRIEEQRKELSHRDEPVFRSSQRRKSWRLITRPSVQPKKVVKVQGSDVDGHTRIDDKRSRKQSSPSRANRRLLPEDGRKHKRSVWSRISGLGRSRKSQMLQEDLALEGLGLSFPVNCKNVRGSSDVPDRYKLDVVEELNVDFTFSENTFLVDFKRRKNKLPANEIDSKDGKGLANGGSCLTGAENMSENHKQKRRKLLRSEISHQGL